MPPTTPFTWRRARCSTSSRAPGRRGRRPQSEREAPRVHHPGVRGPVDRDGAAGLRVGERHERRLAAAHQRGLQAGGGVTVELFADRYQIDAQLGAGGSLSADTTLYVFGGTFDLNGAGQTVSELSGLYGTIALGGQRGKMRDSLFGDLHAAVLSANNG